MMDGKPPFLDTAEQIQPAIEEARQARVEAEEAVDRIQQRIERLVSLSTLLDQPEGDDDGPVSSARGQELAPPGDGSD